MYEIIKAKLLSELRLLGANEDIIQLARDAPIKYIISAILLQTSINHAISKSMENDI